MARLIYVISQLIIMIGSMLPANNYDWFNAKGYTITRPDSIAEKFEFLARKFYPFFEEFFLKLD
ncbi:hypothetical protein [Nostoc sp.]